MKLRPPSLSLQAGYSWWSVGSDQSVWGVPEDIYLALKAGYDAARIPVRGWEPDNNFVVDYYQPESWTGNDLRAWNATLYPSGGRGFVEKLGNLSMVDPRADAQTPPPL